MVNFALKRCSFNYRSHLYWGNRGDYC